MEITENTKRRILDYMKEGKRFDSRNLLDFRDIEIETNISIKAEGSARVRMGKTEVVAGVKMGLGIPYTDSPDSGVLTVTAELLPLSSSKYEPGPPSDDSIEVARIVDRGIRESEFIDLKKLCIEEGKEVWTVYLDIYPINDAGNLIDAAAMASVAALMTAFMPKTEKKDKDSPTRIQYGEFTNKKLPLKEAMPLTITFNKLGSSIYVDPVIEEEESSEARLSIAVSQIKKENYINALQKGGSVPFSLDEMNFILDNVGKVHKKLQDTFLEKLKKSEKASSKEK
jgi:exosome complex component RRP42